MCIDRSVLTSVILVSLIYINGCKDQAAEISQPETSVQESQLFAEQIDSNDERAAETNEPETSVQESQLFTEQIDSNDGRTAETNQPETSVQESQLFTFDFKQIDSNDDGVITLNEFGIATQKSNLSDADSDQKFTDYDLDQDGLIAHNEPKPDQTRDYAGAIVDTEGNPVIQAIISLDGVEAEQPSDTSGHFIVTGISNKPCQMLTVNAVGYEAYKFLVDTRYTELSQCNPQITKSQKPQSSDQHENDEDDKNKESSEDYYKNGKDNDKHCQKNHSDKHRNCIVIIPLPAPAVLDVITPQHESHWTFNPNCVQLWLSVKGFVSQKYRETQKQNFALVIDTSGSTERTTGIDIDGDNVLDSVLGTELIACKALIDTFDDKHNRFGIVKFGRKYSKNAPDGEISTGPIKEGQTRIVQTLTASKKSLDEAITTIAEEGAIGGTDSAAGINLGVELLTSNGHSSAKSKDNAKYTPSLQNIILLTDGIPTLPIEPGETQQAGDRELTIAAALAANRANVRIFPVVIDSLEFAERRLTTMPAVQAITGVSGILPRINANNIDQLPNILTRLPISGISTINVTNHTIGQSWQIPIRIDGFFESKINVQLGMNEITYQIHGGNKNKTKSYTTQVYIHDVDTLFTNSDFTNVLNAIDALDVLTTPTGSRIAGNKLFNLLDEYFSTAMEQPGIDGWRTNQALVSLEVMAKYSNDDSDVGYYLFDPENPPTNATTLLNSLNQENVLFNTSTLLSEYPFEINIPQYSAIGFFIIPNATLTQAQQQLEYIALFSHKALNPGGYDQMLSYYDPVSERIIVAVEEDSIFDKQGGQDFNDLIFNITNVTAMTNVLVCQ